MGFAALGLCLAPGRAAVVYVRQGAGGTPDGASWATAFPTVQQGLNAAQPGDEVWVTAGVYVENVTLRGALYGGFAGAELRREQRRPAVNVTVLDGGAAGSVVTIPEGAANAILDGFTIRNGKAAVGAGVNAAGAHPAVSGNVITGNQGSGAGYTHGGGVFVSSGGSVTGNVICGNSASMGAGIEIGSGTGDATAVRDNLIYGNTAAYEGGGVYAPQWCNPVVTGNTVAGNVALHSGGVRFGPAGTLTNNIIAGNSSGVLFWHAWPNVPYSYVPAPSLANNCLYDNGGHDYEDGDTDGAVDLTPGDAVVTTDPLFADAAHGDYRLLAGSPCIDSGDNAAVGAGERDLDGLPRIAGAHVDLGAFEYGSTAYTMLDVARVLKIAAGLSAPDAADMGRLDVVRDTAGSPRLTVQDAVAIAKSLAP